MIDNQEKFFQELEYEEICDQSIFSDKVKGLLLREPLDYWDYVQVDTLHTLQKPLTSFKDEVIFITYHQVTELVLKMMLHEIEQIVVEKPPFEAFFIQKMDRLIRYTELLINSFDIMKDGMDYDQYNTFRMALAPASGFQSVRFRYIELYATQFKNLVRGDLNERDITEKPIDELFDSLYWKSAGLNHQTGEKTETLKRFEQKYQSELITLAKRVVGSTLEDKFLSIKSPSILLLNRLKEFDYLYNVKWPTVHLQTASHYLDKRGENKHATGGSDWKKYLNPKYQRRCFFPTLWKAQDIFNWKSQ